MPPLPCCIPRSEKVSLLKGLPSYLSWMWFSQWKTTYHCLWIAKCQLVGAAFQRGRYWDGYEASYHGYNYKGTWRHRCLSKLWKMERTDLQKSVFLYGLQFSYCQLLKRLAALHVCVSLISLEGLWKLPLLHLPVKWEPLGFPQLLGAEGWTIAFMSAGL